MHGPSAPQTPPSGDANPIARLERELAEARAYQTAITEVLTVIARSPGQLQPVLDVIARTAYRLCPCDRAVIVMREANGFSTVARAGSRPTELGARMTEGRLTADRNSVFERVMLDGRTTHVSDVTVDPTYDPVPGMPLDGRRTVLGVPLVQAKNITGVITLIRTHVEPFSPRQIALIETFADQAVIAIENARLFEAEQTRTRELAESLEYQTAISEVLGIISTAPREVQPVLDAIASTAQHLCAAERAMIWRIEGDEFRPVAYSGVDAARIDQVKDLRMPLGSGSNLGRAAEAGRAVQALDPASDTTLGEANQRMARTGGILTVVSVPLMQHGQPIGGITVSRTIVAAFSDRQVALLETFASQAVIAIENARLLDELQTRQKELTESLEYQTAITEVLEVISRSPNELQPVIDTIARIAERLCEGDRAQVFIERDGNFELAAYSNTEPDIIANFRANPIGPGRSTATARAALEGRTIHVPDVTVDPEYDQDGFHAMLGGARLVVPLRRTNRTIGLIAIPRKVAKPFTDRQIALVTTFANQAVIAINNVGLFEELQARTKEVTESLEYQTATSDVLSVISRSPNELQPVLDTIVATATRLCGAEYAWILKVETDGHLHLVASRYTDPEFLDWMRAHPMEIGPGTAGGRAVLRRTTVHIPDVLTDPEYTVWESQQRWNFRSMLAVPLLKDRTPIGVIVLLRGWVEPFTERQIELVTTFADQAVIAINNVGLFEQLQARTRELTESLEYQTATSEVLSVMSRSPDQLQPVLDAIVDTAKRLCNADRAYFNVIRDGQIPLLASAGAPDDVVGDVRARHMLPDRGTPAGRVLLEKRTVHIPDARLDPEFALHDANDPRRARSVLAVPLMKSSDVIGVISVARLAAIPFTDRQIALLQTFADQAVIAINNVGLFEEVQARTKELTESLEYQTATSEVLSVISRSPNELQPVLDAIVETAGRLCEADYAHCRLEKDGRYHVMARHSPRPEVIERMAGIAIAADRTSVTGRAVLERRTIHLPDISLDPEETYTERVGSPSRTSLGVPLLRGGEVIGVIGLFRLQVRPFTERQIELVTTFANQAVIAINNVGLFEDVQARTKELARSVEELKSLGAVGQTVSSTLDMRTVLQTVLENAVRISYAGGGTIYVYDPIRQVFHLEAGHNMSEEHIARVRAHPIRLGDRVVGECGERREAVQIEDLERLEGEDSPLLDILSRAGVRAILAVPLLRQDEVIGALVIRRSYAGAFTPETVRLLEAFAAQSAIAVSNARLFREIEEKGEQLRLASQHKSQFLANMSHELRTPLNAILGYTELMVDGAFGQLANEQRETLDRVERNGRHLLGLINDVLDLSKIEAGEMALAIDEYSVGSLIRTAIVATEPLARQKGLSLDARIADQLPLGRGDTRRLAQVLLNLIGNAIKFTDRGGVTISASCEGSSFRIDVRDTGPGIAAGDIARIFEKFQQVDNTSTRKKGGTGLGLAISREFVQMHGGTIDVSSVLGEGAVFTIILPVEADVRRETLH